MGISFCCFCVREGRNTQAFERNDPGTSDEIGVHVPNLRVSPNPVIEMKRTDKQ